MSSDYGCMQVSGDAILKRPAGLLGREDNSGQRERKVPVKLLVRHDSRGSCDWLFVYYMFACMAACAPRNKQPKIITITLLSDHMQSAIVICKQKPHLLDHNISVVWTYAKCFVHPSLPQWLTSAHFLFNWQFVSSFISHSTFCSEKWSKGSFLRQGR